MKLTKKIQLAALSSLLVLFLSGCVQIDKATNQPYGIVYDYLAVPTQTILNWIASAIGGNYVISIMIVSIVVRIILMPTMFKQMKTMLMNQEKMALLKPYIDKMNERYGDNPTPEQRMEVQQYTMDIYRLNNVSLTGGVASGCLPVLVTMPVYSALYNAILYSPEISNSSFMGVSLGSTYLPIAIATAVIYLIQGYISQLYMDETQKAQAKATLFLMPVMMLMFTVGTAAGIGIYFFTSGLTAILQTWIQNQFIRPKVKAEIDAELEAQGNSVILPDTTNTVKTANNAPVSPAQQTFAQRNRTSTGKNSGKQNRK